MQRDLRVCFVGDSFVAGHGDTSALGWVGRVSAAALTAGLPLTAYNLGVRRDTSVLIRDRIRREAGPRLAPANDPRVILSFGVNDTTIEGGAQRVDPHESVLAFRQSVRAVAPAEVAFVTAPAVDDDAQNERIHDLNQLLLAEAAACGVLAVDTFAATSEDEVWRREVRDGDRFHPDSAGYERLAGLVTAPLLDWLS